MSSEEDEGTRERREGGGLTGVKHELTEVPPSTGTE